MNESKWAATQRQMHPNVCAHVKAVTVPVFLLGMAALLATSGDEDSVGVCWFPPTQSSSFCWSSDKPVDEALLDAPFGGSGARLLPFAKVRRTSSMIPMIRSAFCVLSTA
eukprot:scaffold7362_cov266-Pinguiococcus_pyrenoidosus.AAC.12